MTCAFCKVAAGETDAAVVFEDDATLAFLDHRPLFPGHVLLIPKVHYEILQDLPADLLAPTSRTRSASPPPWKPCSAPRARSSRSTTA
jgi:histidine triad (HIT) family protein